MKKLFAFLSLLAFLIVIIAPVKAIPKQDAKKVQIVQTINFQNVVIEKQEIKVDFAIYLTFRVWTDYYAESIDNKCFDSSGFLTFEYLSNGSNKQNDIYMAELDRLYKLATHSYNGKYVSYGGDNFGFMTDLIHNKNYKSLS